MTSQTQMKSKPDKDSNCGSTIFDNKSSVIAFSQHDCNDKDESKNMVDSEDILFSQRRPQGFMTAYKGKKIFMTVNEVDLAPKE
jgi:hypothetical protein